MTACGAHYLFCLRHYNDIDNIVPAIYFLLEREPVRVTVLIYSLDYDYTTDPSLVYLRNRFASRVRIEWIGALAGYDSTPLKILGLPIYKTSSRKLLEQIDASIRESSHDQRVARWIAPLFVHWGIPRKAVFDQNRSTEIAGLMKALRGYGVERIITLPVSPWVNVNVLRQVDFVRIDAERFWEKHDYSGFDAIGQVDRFYSESLNEFFSLLGQNSPFHGQEAILGSIRYCHEWLRIRDTYAKGAHPEYVTGKIPLLVIPSHRKNNSFWDEFIRTLHFIGQYQSYDILVKPHTRYSDGYKNLPENVKLVPEFDTSTLIDWAEIVLFWGSSAALEGFQKEKAMVCLDYLNGNRSVFSLFRAGYQCHCRDDLMKFLVLYPESGRIRQSGANTSGHELLIREVIQGGRSGAVPDFYVDYLTEG